MKIEDAKVCLNCDEVFEEADVCPKCTSTNVYYISKWLKK